LIEYKENSFGRGEESVHLVPAKSIGLRSQPKEYGGLTVLNLKNMNKAVLSKWLWKYFSQPELMWRWPVELMYYKDTNIFQHKEMHMTTFWKNVT